MLFLGCLFPKEAEERLLQQSKCGLSNAANLFQWNLIDGINQHLPTPVTVYNALPVGVYPTSYKKLILKNKKWINEGVDCYEIGCVNLPFIKQQQRFSRCYRLLKNSADKNILIYSAYLPFLKAIKKLDSSYCVTAVITDLPEYYDLGKTNIIRRILRQINTKIVYSYIKRVDNFVLLTEHMKVPLQVGNRPYTILEGICSASTTKDVRDAGEGKEKIILYTGTLHERFGIGDLIKAFMKIPFKNFRLWVCGSGDQQEYVKRAEKEDERIKFWGYLTKQQISELQSMATVLVNPRKNNELYTKYSFPSKTVEYLSTGIPVVAYKLDGIPDEYDKYINYVNGDSIDDLTSVLISVCQLDVETRKEMGQKGADFVLREKNNVVQAKKVLDFINQNTRV